MHALYRSQFFSLGFLFIITAVFGLTSHLKPAYDTSLGLTITISGYSFACFVYCISKLFLFKENEEGHGLPLKDLDREDLADISCFLISGTVIPGIVAVLHLRSYSLSIIVGWVLAILAVVSSFALLRVRRMPFFVYLVLTAAIQFIAYYFATDEKAFFEPIALAFIGLMAVSAVFFVGRHVLPASEH